MKISLNFLARIVGMLLLAYIGARVGQGLSSPHPNPDEVVATQLLTLAGAGLGLLTTHLWTIEPARRLIHYIRSISIVELTAMVFGALLGALLALLLSVPLSFLPAPLGQFLPVIVAGALAYLGGLVFVTRRKEIATLLQSRRSSIAVPQQVLDSLHPSHRYLIDTSAIIDGRIAAVSELGFLEGTLLVPHFVLTELQALADSSDEMRRSKGRRGLEMLNTMQKEAATDVEIVDADVADVQEVDD
ncbi:MAG TPA: twitching motility protein PilT, partial [Roseiflexaceae bacterium]|nr:twitching motility protein PilT [Roseiflexaceae bacterium]